MNKIAFLLGLIVMTSATAHGRDETPLAKLIGHRTLDIVAATDARERSAARLLDERGEPALPGFAWGELNEDERRDIAIDLAVEEARQAEIARLWARPADAGGIRPTSLQSEFVDRLWRSIADHDRMSSDLRHRGRRTLAALAVRAPALWTTNWMDFPREDSPRLEARLEVLAETLGRTVNHARAAHDRGEVWTARDSALDALRLVTEVYLLSANTLGDRREQCDRATAYQTLTGAVTLSFAFVGGLAACTSGSPLMIAAAVATTSVAVPTTYAGFANIGRQFEEKKAPLLFPEFAKRHYRRKSAERALRNFWISASHYGMSLDQWMTFERDDSWMQTLESRAENARTWFMNLIGEHLGDDDAEEFCERLLAPPPEPAA